MVRLRRLRVLRETVPSPVVSVVSLAPPLSGLNLAVTPAVCRSKAFEENRDGPVRCVRQRLRQSVSGYERRPHDDLRQLRMRDPRDGALLRALRLQDRRAWGRGRRQDVLLRPLRPAPGRHPRPRRLVREAPSPVPGKSPSPGPRGEGDGELVFFVPPPLAG